MLAKRIFTVLDILGEILDIAEIAATPALIQGCVKGIEKEGKAEFKVFGKKHSLSLGASKEAPHHAIVLKRSNLQTSLANSQRRGLPNQVTIPSQQVQHATNAHRIANEPHHKPSLGSQSSRSVGVIAPSLRAFLIMFYFRSWHNKRLQRTSLAPSLPALLICDQQPPNIAGPT